MKIYRAHKLLNCAAAMTIAVASFGAPAYAQTVSAGAETDDNLIIVTATRSEQALNKVPLSVAVLSQQQLDDRGVRKFDDIARLTPGVQFNNQGAIGRNNVAIRGVSSLAGASTTGVYIDDVPVQARQVGFGAGTQFPLIFDLDRVEVLRGPQGTLFGAGSMGGTIRFIQTKPSTSTFSGYARAEGATTVGSAGSYEAGAAFGGPIVADKIGFRLSGYFRRDGGWIDRVPGTITRLAGPGNSPDPDNSIRFTQTGPGNENVNWTEAYALRGALRFEPAEGFSITPSVFYQERKIGSGVQNYLLGQGASDPSQHRFIYIENRAGAPNLATGIASMSLPDNESGKSNLLVASVESEWLTDDVAVNLTTSYLSTNKDQFLDFTTGYETTYHGQKTPRPGARGTSIYSDDQRNFTAEFRMSSRNTGSKFSWLVGAFYYDSQQKSEQLIEVNTAKNTTSFFGIGNLTNGNPFGPGNSSFNNTWGAPLIGESGYYFADARTDEKQIAGFAEVSYKPVEGLTLTAGVRWARNLLTYSLVSDGPENNSNAPYGASCRKPDRTIGVAGVDCIFNAAGFWAPEYPGGVQPTAENTVNPKFAISYEIDDRNMVYASASKGFRPGGGQVPLPTACDSGLLELGRPLGPNGRPTTPPQFLSDSLWSYEVGTKNSFADGKINFSGSAYQINWSNIQTNRSVPICGYAFVENVSSARIRGFDFLLDVTPFDGFTIGTTVGYTKTKLGSANTPIINAGPPWQVVVYVDYRYALSDKVKAYFHADYSYSDPIAGPLTPTAANLAIINAYEPLTLVNARIGARFSGVDVSVFASNLFDASPRNFVGRGNQVLWTAATFRPRTVGLTAAYRY